MKGIIALDIDGTITATHHSIDEDVVAFLHQLYNEGWVLSFITGRSFQWGFDTLQYLDFPYYFAVQNGAILMDMPSRKILLKKYLDKSIFPQLDKICADEPTDFVIYGGYEHQDRCYYRPNHFEPDTLKYVHSRFTKLGESWTALGTYDDLPIEIFTSVKCIAPKESAERIAYKMESELNLHAPLVQDPFSPEYYVVQGTRGDVDKGHAVTDLVKLLKIQGPVIVAGDDNNDIPMFEVADVKVVMATARPEILQYATIIAPAAKDKGIIQGLKQALEYVSNHP